MLIVGLIVAWLCVILLLIYHPGVGIAVLIFMLMSLIEEGSHGKLPLISYVKEGIQITIHQED